MGEAKKANAAVWAGQVVAEDRYLLTPPRLIFRAALSA